MAFTIPEALKRAQNPMTAMMLKSIATTDELGALISIETVPGTSVKLDREGTLPTTGFLADNHAEASTGGINESSGTDDVPEVQFRRIVGDVDIDLMAEGVGGSTPEAKRNRLISKKAKATWRLMKDKLINGGHTTGHNFGSSIVGATGIAVGINSMLYSSHLDSSRRGPGSIKFDLAGAPEGARAWYFRAPGDIAYGPGALDGNADKVIASGTGLRVRSHNPSLWVTLDIDVTDVTADDEVPVYFTSSNNEFDGLAEMTDPGLIVPVVGGTGDAFSIAMLDELIDIQKVREQRAFVMNGKLVNEYYAALRLLGGADPAHVVVPGYGAPVPTYRGIPILTNDNFTSYAVGGTTCSDMALVSLNPDEGLVLAAQDGGNPFSPDADPRVRSVLGFRITNLGELEGKDAERVRVKWYGAPVLKSPLASAIKQGVQQ